jgi:hypothetical protein
MAGFPIVVQSLSAEVNVISRARRLSSDEEISLVEHLGPPTPLQVGAFGRCNQPNQPFLYAGANVPLLFSEINVNVGDRVGLIHLRPIRDLKLLNLGAIDMYRRTSGYCMLDSNIKAHIAGRLLDKGNGIRIPLMDAFIADHFSRPADLTTYKLTSAFTDVILSGAPKLDGIVYDSVNHRGGKCYGTRAALFPSHVVPCAAQIVRVTAKHGYGIFDFVEEKFSETFVGRHIIWAERNSPRSDWFQSIQS